MLQRSTHQASAWPCSSPAPSKLHPNPLPPVPTPAHLKNLRYCACSSGLPQEDRLLQVTGVDRPVPRWSCVVRGWGVRRLFGNRPCCSVLRPGVDNGCRTQEEVCRHCPSQKPS